MTAVVLQLPRLGSGLLSSFVNCGGLNKLHSMGVSHTFISWSIYYTGGAVNTARAFGPAVVTGFPYGTQWVVRMPPFTTYPLTSRITSVLGWSMLGVIPGNRVLHNPEAVRYRLGYTSTAATDNNGYTTAGITGLSTRIKPLRIRECLLRTRSLPYDREPPASDESPMTIMNKRLQMQKNLELRPAEAPTR